jgi:hypothetical protein
VKSSGHVDFTWEDCDRKEEMKNAKIFKCASAAFFCIRRLPLVAPPSRLMPYLLLYPVSEIWWVTCFFLFFIVLLLNLRLSVGNRRKEKENQ